MAATEIWRATQSRRPARACLCAVWLICSELRHSVHHVPISRSRFGMDPLIATAASGMRSRIETLDILANNIANAGTTGYKADEASYNLYFGADAWDAYNEGRAPGTEMPVVEKNWTDLSQGTIIPTGNSSDLALTSSGFFTVD